MASLITANKDWNEALIQTEFCRADADCILGIPLSRTDGKDTLIWHFKKNGRFTVKSAYSLACDMRMEGNCSQLGRSWKFIWSLKAPPKVVLFAWRCALEALPITVNLKRRGVLVNEGCGGCTTEKEDVLHVLWYCSFGRLVWVISGLPWKALLCNSSGTEEWFRSVFGELDRPSWDFFLSVCWALWGMKNRRIFEVRLKMSSSQRGAFVGISGFSLIWSNHVWS
ncbi:UNVERIFIED_CONTAM: hypothetical protein Slati_3406200 [Sesamum latifolium]|uniref:Reverse transcriptase zinc-binding domain-containing protein n=1 Tax=Sesamum latifolium TaxID=2727402 RepID=A0AAW2UGP0_9LAMI